MSMKGKSDSINTSLLLSLTAPRGYMFSGAVAGGLEKVPTKKVGTLLYACLLKGFAVSMSAEQGKYTVISAYKTAF